MDLTAYSTGMWSLKFSCPNFVFLKVFLNSVIGISILIVLV
jgi:hypothetical protein